ncbi:MAG: malto-oligosyltrehalose synthase [Nitrospiraceae bacterium]|nr:MAG: malto-oligosyltrehalose synthase [Nitrospiraceae bacterium]
MEKEKNMARIPVSTYRVQFSRDFRFTDARDIVRYLYELGISDIYSSPYLGAKKGSLHGYDIVDHNVLNPEVGTMQEYEDLMKELRNRGMGQMLDIVPNHMGIGSQNPFWMDLLENGMSSDYAEMFDIDWDPVKRELKDRLLLPMLGDQYGTVLENGELKLHFHEGAFSIHYYEHVLPVRPVTYIHILRHDVKTLEDSSGIDNPHVIELLSIITALDHLPCYTERDPEKIRERNREKEIVKKRIWVLYNESPEIRAFIDNNVKRFNGTIGNQESFDLLDNLLSTQVYRLSYWRVAAEEINYRRFFDINELAAIRMEKEEVFSRTHRLVMELVRKGHVTGLRVDHPDGLYNPVEYFRHLQRECYIHSHMDPSPEISSDAAPSATDAGLLQKYVDLVNAVPQFKPFYIVGEKILIKGERMPEDWPIFSTTGYVFLNLLNGIFIDTANAKAFDDIYSKFIRSKSSYSDIVYEKKKLIMYVAMASEITTLAHYLNIISERNRHTRDFTLYSLRSAIVEVIAFFPVYRTYTSQHGVNDRDRKYIEYAVSKAKRKNPAISESIYEFLKNVLMLNFHDCCTDEDRKEWLDFVMRFQQLTGPVMAKGAEDTAFYVYNRLVSLNEVGGSPDRLGTTLETFHGQNIERTKNWPYALITTSTHDAKRGEDVRARLNVLSEIPGEWKDCLLRWKRLNRKKKMKFEGLAVPDRNEEYLLYQTLVGAWPVNLNTPPLEKGGMGGFEGELLDKSSYELFKTRIKDYMLKAVREAKVNSSWINPNTRYEEVLMLFIEKVMETYPGSQFLQDFLPFQKRVSHYGMFNSLSQTLLKMTSPGVPDFYQGTDLWSFTLVDPDNRGSVDYTLRVRMLEELKRKEAGVPLHLLARELVEGRESGAIKLYLTYKTLNFRRDRRKLFEEGEYMLLEAEGTFKDNICCFARRYGQQTVIVAAPRFFTRLAPAETLPLAGGIWQDTNIVLPFKAKDNKYRNIFTGTTVTAVDRDENQVLPIQEIIRDFPVVLLEEV